MHFSNTSESSHCNAFESNAIIHHRWSGALFIKKFLMNFCTSKNVATGVRERLEFSFLFELHTLHFILCTSFSFNFILFERRTEALENQLEMDCIRYVNCIEGLGGWTYQLLKWTIWNGQLQKKANSILNSVSKSISAPFSAPVPRLDMAEALLGRRLLGNQISDHFGR